jgi:hypothetical protein
MTRDLADTVKGLFVDDGNFVEQSKERARQVAEHLNLECKWPDARFRWLADQFQAALLTQRERIEPVVRDLIAQATADALDLASEHVPNFGQSWNLASCSCGWEVKWDNQCEDRTRLWQQHIRALIPADIAAKAKEREERIEQLECQLAGCDIAAMGWADKNPDSPPPKQGDWGWSPAFQSVLELRQKWEAQREHDAKIRREAFDQILAFAQSRGWDGAVAIITRDFKWANEADGGGK